jgi:hypothetical protein
VTGLERNFIELPKKFIEIEKGDDRSKHALNASQISI